MLPADGFGDREWFEAWIEAFHPAGAAAWVDLPGLAEPVPFVVESVPVLKSSQRFLRAPVNAHTPRWGLKLSEPLDVARVSRALRDALRDTGGAGLELGLVPDGSPTHRLLQALSGTGEWTMDAREAERTALVDTSGDWEAYFASRSKKLRKQLAAHERQLQERGHLTFVEVSRDDDWRQWYRRVLELEAAGWKGREGTAIVQHPEQVKFYERVTEAAHARGALRLLVGTLDGRLIASRLDIIEGDVQYFIKTTYDETLARLAPGHLVRQHALRAIFADPTVLRVDFLGPVSEAKSAWATHFETLLEVRLVPSGSAAGWLLRGEALARSIRARLTGEGAG